jgi:hypothetical protein
MCMGSVQVRVRSGRGRGWLGQYESLGKLCVLMNQTAAHLSLWDICMCHLLIRFSPRRFVRQKRCITTLIYITQIILRRFHIRISPPIVPSVPSRHRSRSCLALAQQTYQAWHPGYALDQRPTVQRQPRSQQRPSVTGHKRYQVQRQCSKTEAEARG